MSFIINCNNNEKIKVDINKENVQKSKLLIEFYEEYKDEGVLYITFNGHLVRCFINSIDFKFNNIEINIIKFETVYTFLNYLIVDNDVMINYLSYIYYKIDFEDIKCYIENIIDKSFLKILLEQKEGIVKCVEDNDIVAVFIGVKSGADINIQNKYGSTALYYASWNGRIEVAKVLLKSGAEINM